MFPRSSPKRRQARASPSRKFIPTNTSFAGASKGEIELALPHGVTVLADGEAVQFDAVQAAHLPRVARIAPAHPAPAQAQPLFNPMKTADVIARLAQLRLVPRHHSRKRRGRQAARGGPARRRPAVREVTFRTAAALEAISVMAQVSRPAGRRGHGAEARAGAGRPPMPARNSSSRRFNPRVVSYCVSHGIPITPGVSNPTIIEMAIEHGLDVVKFSQRKRPAACHLKAIAAPYGAMRYIPTGGIEPGNLRDYWRSPKWSPAAARGW